MAVDVRSLFRDSTPVERVWRWIALVLAIAAGVCLFVAHTWWSSLLTVVALALPLIVNLWHSSNDTKPSAQSCRGHAD